MKSIPLPKTEKFKPLNILKQVCEHSQGVPLSISKMRLRVKILDKIEAVEKAESIEKTPAVWLRLEDAEYVELVLATNGFPWAVASKELLFIIDSVLDADKNPAPSKKEQS